MRPKHLTALGGDPIRRNHVKRIFVIAIVAATSFAAMHSDLADAARMGGGRSFGMQRSILPPAARTAPSTGTFSGPAANPVMPATPAARTPGVAGAAAAATPSRASRWLGPLAGLAAGFGLAALFSHLGMSEGLGSLLLIGLLAAGAVALFRAFAARRNAAQPYGYAGATPAPVRATPLPLAREAIEPEWGPAPAVDAGRYPPGFDPVPFLAQAKQQFVRLQAAYDRGDRALLGEVTTPEMQAELTHELEARRGHVPTEVVNLDAEIVEVVEEANRYVASIRFHGSLREDGNATPQPFEELWHLVKPVDGRSGWLLAGIQQYA